MKTAEAALSWSSGLMVSRLETNQILKANRSLVRKLEKILGLQENALVASATDDAGAEKPKTPQGAEPGSEEPVMRMNYCRRC